MNIDRVQQQLEIDEGVVYEIYEDHLGYKTFGVGHLVRRDDAEYGKDVGTCVPYVRVKEAFQQDLGIAVYECTLLYDCWDDLPEEVQEILVNMLFNLGRPRLSKFKNMNKAITSRDWRLAAIEGTDSLWYQQVGARAERLMKRLRDVNT
jgi:lysozyme